MGKGLPIGFSRIILLQVKREQEHNSGGYPKQPESINIGKHRSLAPHDPIKLTVGHYLALRVASAEA